MIAHSTLPNIGIGDGAVTAHAVIIGDSWLFCSSRNGHKILSHLYYLITSVLKCLNEKGLYARMSPSDTDCRLTKRERIACANLVKRSRRRWLNARPNENACGNFPLISCSWRGSMEASLP